MTDRKAKRDSWDEAPVAAPKAAGKAFTIYTDGACQPNPGPGGWGWHRCDGQQANGGARRTTSNRMELTAILRALEALPTGSIATVYTDSQYCQNGLTKWCNGWARRNWIKKDGEPVVNADLWQAIEAQKKRSKVKFVWVRSHSGNAGNEKADGLAVYGRLAAAQQVAA